VLSLITSEFAGLL